MSVELTKYLYYRYQIQCDYDKQICGFPFFGTFFPVLFSLLFGYVLISVLSDNRGESTLLAAAPSSSLFPFLFSVVFRSFSVLFCYVLISVLVDNLAESTLLGGGKIKKKRSKLEDRQKAPCWLVGKSGGGEIEARGQKDPGSAAVYTMKPIQTHKSTCGNHRYMYSIYSIYTDSTLEGMQLYSRVHTMVRAGKKDTSTQFNCMVVPTKLYERNK